MSGSSQCQWKELVVQINFIDGLPSAMMGMRKRDPAVQIRFLGAKKSTKVIKDAKKGRVMFFETLSFPYMEKCNEKSVIAFEVVDRDSKALSPSMANCEVPFTQVYFACQTKGGKYTVNVKGDHRMTIDVVFTLIVQPMQQQPMQQQPMQQQFMQGQPMQGQPMQQQPMPQQQQFMQRQPMQHQQMQQPVQGQVCMQPCGNPQMIMQPAMGQPAFVQQPRLPPLGFAEGYALGQAAASDGKKKEKKEKKHKKSKKERRSNRGSGSSSSSSPSSSSCSGVSISDVLNQFSDVL